MCAYIYIYIYVYIYYIHVCELCMSYKDAGLGDMLVGGVCMRVNESCHMSSLT